MTQVTVTSNRTTVYGPAHQETRVELTPRVQALIDAGILITVPGAASLRTAPGTATEPDPLPPRADLVQAAERRGIEVPGNWTRKRIAEEIALHDQGQARADHVQAERG